MSIHRQYSLNNTVSHSVYCRYDTNVSVPHLRYAIVFNIHTQFTQSLQMLESKLIFGDIQVALCCYPVPWNQGVCTLGGDNLGNNVVLTCINVLSTVIIDLKVLDSGVGWTYSDNQNIQYNQLLDKQNIINHNVSEFKIPYLSQV